MGDIMKIITGGQSGGDLAGIYFAKKYHIPCKINTFKDFYPITGNLPDDVEIEYVCDTGNYISNLRERTKYNVQNSDFTLILLNTDIMFTKGSKLTYNLCMKLKKDVMYIDINTHIGSFHDKTWSYGNTRVIQSIESAREIIKSKNIQVLNVAGQREINEYNALEFLEKLLL